MEKKRFADFAEEPTIMDGEKVKIESVLNREIEILGIRITNSRYDKNKSGKCLTLQFADPDTKKRHVLFTGSDVLISQCEKYQSQMPFYATIRKIDRYCVLT